jgi:hypothetical protein
LATRVKECCTSGLISGPVRGILFVFVGAILALLLGKIPPVVYQKKVVNSGEDNKQV